VKTISQGQPPHAARRPVARAWLGRKEVFIMSVRQTTRPPAIGSRSLSSIMPHGSWNGQTRRTSAPGSSAHLVIIASGPFQAVHLAAGFDSTGGVS